MMSYTGALRTRWPALLAASAVLLSAASAQADVYVVRVEEDWELMIGEPDANVDAPQVVAVMSPRGHVQSVHSTLELNHQNLPEFVAGGLQLQLWDGEERLTSQKFPDPDIMRTNGEVVRWTQAMEATGGGSVKFEVLGGESQTWGSFGGQGYLRITEAAGVLHLNDYDPAVSVANSGVAFASNRVDSLVLKEVRLVLSNGEVLTDDTVRVVHERQ